MPEKSFLPDSDMHESDDKVTVSVVIPVYNSGKYLSAAIESVLGQSFSDLELILVNDGSTDNSGEVIRRYEAADRRVRSVTTRNQGPSLARMEGVRIARGEWVQFLDSDDTMLPDAIGPMVDRARLTGADMVIPRFVYRFADGSEQLSAEMSRPMMTGLEYLGEIMHNRGYWSICVMTRRELFGRLENISAGVSFGEDAVWKTQLLFHAGMVARESTPAFVYIERAGSLSNSESFTDKKYGEWLAYNGWIEDFLTARGVAADMAEPLAVMRKINLFQQIHWRRMDGVDEKMQRLIADIRLIPAVKDSLTRRERKIVGYYRLGRWVGRKLLERKLRRHGGLKK